MSNIFGRMTLLIRTRQSREKREKLIFGGSRPPNNGDVEEAPSSHGAFLKEAIITKNFHRRKFWIELFTIEIHI